MIKLTNLIPEINIKPNRPYQVGDYFITVNSKNQTPSIITSIRNGNVYYDSVDEDWGKDGNFRLREDFDRYIKDGSWKIIPKPKDIDEIKIQPNLRIPKEHDIYELNGVNWSQRGIYQIISVNIEKNTVYLRNTNNYYSFALNLDNFNKGIKSGEITFLKSPNKSY